MKNHVIILAGGIGSRVGETIPKQFLSLGNKPIIVHTIMNFQKCASVEDILVVCISDWINYVEAIVAEYELNKVRWIMPGGKNSHESIKNGLFYLQGMVADNDYIIIHDAVRPILPQVAIEEMLNVAHEKGNASLAIPCYETVVYTQNQLSGDKEVNRDSIMRVQTPQTYRYDYLLSLYKQAERDGKCNFVYANTVVIHYGGTVFFSKGFTNNIKITKKQDIALCESLMKFSDKELFD